MLGLGVEKGVCDAEIMMAAEFKQALSISIHASNAKVTQTGWPSCVVSAHSGVEISKDE